MAETRREVQIRSAEEFYTFCVNRLQDVGQGIFPSQAEKHQTAKWSFILVQTDEINRVHPDRKVKTVPGTMGIHFVKAEEPFTIVTRHLSCFCEECCQILLENNSLMHALDSTRADFVLPVDHSDCLVEGDADQLSDVSENIYSTNKFEGVAETQNVHDISAVEATLLPLASSRKRDRVISTWVKYNPWKRGKLLSSLTFPATDRKPSAALDKKKKLVTFCRLSVAVWQVCGET
ncbi:hypothetical protein ScPMuIL_017523 [Solemya velum]